MSSLKDGDFAEAFCLWRPLAIQGHAEAGYHLGWLYANGNGLRVDIDKAIYWWKRSASQGHADAMFALALAYTNGEGIKKNQLEAFKWYRKAAEKGHDDARDIIKAKLLNPEKALIEQLRAVLSADWLSEQRLVQGDLVNLRGGPGKDHPVVRRVSAGSRLLVVDRSGKWLLTIDPDNLSQAWIAEWLTKLSN
ncbi:MAG: hypothetical protein P8163_11735 [Candidatus Thiodiazotropha sp.]